MKIKIDNVIIPVVLLIGLIGFAHFIMTQTKNLAVISLIVGSILLYSGVIYYYRIRPLITKIISLSGPRIVFKRQVKIILKQKAPEPEEEKIE